MPQFAPSLHLEIRSGGYAPLSGFHFPVIGDIDASLASAVANLVKPALSTETTITKWEAQTELGTVVDGGILSVQGTWPAVFSDFKDSVHFTLQSEGEKGDSGFYLPGRPVNAFELGSPVSAYNTIVTNMINGLISLGLRDSEGNLVSKLKRYGPSRRRKIRTAP